LANTSTKRTLLDLCVEEARAALAAQRRRVLLDRGLERAVHVGGGHGDGPRIVERERVEQDPFEPEPRVRARAQHHGLGHEAQPALELALHLGSPPGVGDLVPLVQHEQDRPAAVEREPRQLGVLLAHPHARVEHEQRHVRALERAQRHQRTAALEVIRALAAAAHAGGVDQHDLPPCHREMRVGRVASRAGLSSTRSLRSSPSSVQRDDCRRSAGR
jgi:hypothetical protein